MNFDELKDTWQQVGNGELQLPNHIERMQPALSPIEKIKKNMKKELYMQTASFVLLGLYPFLFNLSTVFISVYFVVYILFFSVSTTYIIKFKKFFKYINHFNLNSKDSLYEVYYEIKVNIETYKSWNYACIPFGIVAIMILTIGRTYNKATTHSLIEGKALLMKTGLIFGLSYLIFYLLVAVITHYWIQHFYGKYLLQIKELLNDLKED